LEYLREGSNPDFFEATLIYDGITWEHIGIRYKGNSTLENSWKTGMKNLPLRFNFDYYEDDYPETENQRFFGFKKMTMGNMIQDSTLIREKIASDLFGESGVPVAKTSFYEVYLDSGDGSDFLGLYTMIEDPSDDFLDDRFGNNDGKLYKPEGEGAWLTTFNDSLYEEKLNDDGDYTEMKSLINHLGDYEMENSLWREKFEKLFDVESFITFLAVNNCILNWDTYGVAPHNFYLYSDPEKEGRITFIPWDLNESFNRSQKVLSLSLNEIDDSWPLIFRIKNDEVYKQLYYQKISDFIKGPFSPESISRKLEKYEQMVEKYTKNEQGRSRRNETPELSLLFQERRETILKFLEETPSYNP
jgi:spore coat protein CotH